MNLRKPLTLDDIEEKIKEHSEIFDAAMTHANRLIFVIEKVTSQKDDPDVGRRIWDTIEELGEALESVGNDMQKVGVWGQGVLEMLREAIDHAE